MLVWLSVLNALRNGWTDIDEIICVCLNGFPGWLDLQLDPVGPTRGGTQTGILRFTMEIFVYKWLLLVLIIINGNYLTSMH